MEINNYLSVIRTHKFLIKANMNKLPEYYEHMYDSTDDELKDELATYKKEGIIIKYKVLRSFRKRCKIYQQV